MHILRVPVFISHDLLKEYFQILLSMSQGTADHYLNMIMLLGALAQFIMV